MRWIIIDDSEYKVENFKRYLSEDDQICSFNCFIKGMYELAKNYTQYDVLVLDMNFPVCEREDIVINAGLNVLQELDRKEINIPVVIYSSEKVDIGEYKNIIEYINYDSSVSIKSTVESIKEKVKNI
jgi:CheY-like chemotaxis protein